MLKEITTVGDLKKLLDGIDDNIYVDFGTERVGFVIDSYRIDNINLSLFSSNLAEYLDRNNDL